jgi:hypothetical protein
MAKNRKKIRHRKTINGGAGDGEQEGQETSQQKYERIKNELIGSGNQEYEEIIDAFENLRSKFQ